MRFSGPGNLEPRKLRRQQLCYRVASFWQLFECNERFTDLDCEDEFVVCRLSWREVSVSFVKIWCAQGGHSHKRAACLANLS